MKTLLIIFCALLCFEAYSQSKDSSVILTVKRSIWFYPGTPDNIKNRFTIGPGNQIYFRRIPGDKSYQASYLNRQGYVDANQVTPEFQYEFDTLSLRESILGVSSPMQGQADLSIQIIQQAGTRIRNGAGAVIIGTVISLAGGAAGILVGKNNPDTGYIIAGGAGVLGLAIGIGGMANISTGGGLLQDYGRPVK